MYHGNMYNLDRAQQRPKLTSGEEHTRQNPRSNRGLLRNKAFIKAVVLLLGLVILVDVEDLLQLGKVIQPLHRTLHAHLCADVSAMERRENDLRDSLRFLSEKRRQLCHFYWLDKEPGTDEWEYFYEPSYKTARQDVQLPTGDDNIAFVVTLTHCPDDTNKPPVGSNCHPDDIFFDEMSMLRFSTCHWNADHHDSESNYESTMYAIIHTNAVVCPGPNGVLYDRAKLLQDQGYWVIIQDEPVYEDDILGSSFLKQHINGDVGIRDLIKLYAYKLVNHPLVVLIDFDTLIMKPLDDIFDALLDPDSPTRDAKAATTPVTGTYMAGISTGMLVLKPSLEDYNALIDIFANSTYTNKIGWDGTGISRFPGALGTAGLLAYYYSKPENPTLPMDRCIYNNGNEHCCRWTPVELIKVRRMLCETCGKPNECSDHMHLDSRTRFFCRSSLHEWFKGRVEYEYDLWDKQDLPARGGAFLPDVFMGYCKNKGESGYVPMLVNEAVAPAKNYVAGEVIDPVCDTTCGAGTYLKTDCTCTPPEEPCQACPYGMKCYEPKDGTPLMCLDCSCGFCNKQGEACCDFNGVNNCKSNTEDKECKLQFGFYPQFDGKGHACSGVELNVMAVPNGCGCKPEDNLPCIYDPNEKTLSSGCFICNAKDLVLGTAECSMCYECMVEKDSAIATMDKNAATAVEDMQDLIAAIDFDSRLACDTYCRKDQT